MVNPKFGLPSENLSSPVACERSSSPTAVTSHVTNAGLCLGRNGASVEIHGGCLEHRPRRVFLNCWHFQAQWASGKTPSSPCAASWHPIASLHGSLFFLAQEMSTGSTSDAPPQTFLLFPNHLFTNLTFSWQHLPVLSPGEDIIIKEE